MGKLSTTSGKSRSVEKTAAIVPGATIDDYTTSSTDQTLENSLSSIEADLGSLSSASASSSKKKKKKKSSSKDKHHQHHHHHHHEKDKHHHHHHHHAAKEEATSEGHDKEGRADYHWEKHDSARKLGLPKKTHSSSSSKSGRSSKSKRRPSSSSSVSSASKSVEKGLQKLDLGDDGQEDDIATFTDQASSTTASALLLDEDDDVPAKSPRERVAAAAALDKNRTALLDDNSNIDFEDEVYGLDEEELDMEEDEALHITTAQSPSPHHHHYTSSSGSSNHASPMVRRSSKSSSGMSPMARPTTTTGVGGNPSINNRSLSPPMSMLRQSLRDSFSHGGSINNASSSFIPPFLVDNDDDDDEEEEEDEEGNTKAGDGVVNHPSSAYRRVSSSNVGGVGHASTSSIGSKGGHNSADLSAVIDELDFVPEAMGMDEGIPEGW